MKEINFPHWPERLAQTALPERQKQSFAITLRWYSYRTEQSYLVWLERFARFCRTEDLASRGAEDLKRFLDALALDQRLSASSQRQALNALVFLLREVFGQELGRLFRLPPGQAPSACPGLADAR